MRTPKRHVYVDGTVSYKVRFRLEGEDTSTVFKGPPEIEPETKEAAVAFAKMIAAVGPREALDWQRRNDADEVVESTAPTLDEWAATYIAGRTAVTEGTRHGYSRTYALSYGQHLGHLPIDKITRADIAAALNDLSTRGRRDGTGYSDKSMRNAHGLLASMLKEAQAEGLIPANPSARIKLGRRTTHNRAEMVLMSRDDFEHLVLNLPEHYRPLVMTLGGTGIRWGEAEALDVRDFDPDARTLRINKAAKWDTRKSRRVVGPTKTRHSDRTVTLPDAVVDALLPLVEGRARSARLFIAPRGGPLNHKTFWEGAWVPACEKAGLVDPRPRIHDCRHSHASWLIAAGVPLPVIQRRLGHHSITVTVDTYGHLTPDLERQAADAAQLVFDRPALVAAE